MSRTVLSALRKYRSPASFVERFLLPTYKRGRIPKLPARTLALGKLPEKRRPASPIVFVNANNPHEELQLRIERENTAQFKSKPNVIISRGQKKGARVDLRDWEEGMRFAHTTQKGIFEEMEIDEEHISPEWQKEAVGSGKLRYPIPEPLFREMKKYATAGQSMSAIITLIRLAEGNITPQQMLAYVPFIIRQTRDPIGDLIRAIPMSRASIHEMLATKDQKKIIRVFQREFGVDQRYAYRLAKHFLDRRTQKFNTAGVEFLLDMYFGRR